MHPDRRRPHVDPLQHLRGAAEASALVPVGRFAELLDGLMDLRRAQSVQPALILAHHPAMADRWELAAAVLMANLREADVICRLDPQTGALALDAGPRDARAVARRVHHLLQTTFVSGPSWVGVAVARPDLLTGADLLAVSHAALDEARQHRGGAILGVGTPPG